MSIAPLQKERTQRDIYMNSLDIHIEDLKLQNILNKKIIKKEEPIFEVKGGVSIPPPSRDENRMNSTDRLVEHIEALRQANPIKYYNVGYVFFEEILKEDFLLDSLNEAIECVNCNPEVQNIEAFTILFEDNKSIIEFFGIGLETLMFFSDELNRITKKVVWYDNTRD